MSVLLQALPRKSPGTVSKLVKSPAGPGQLTELRSSFALNCIEKKLEEGLESVFENLSSLASALRVADPSKHCTELFKRLKQEVNRSFESSRGSNCMIESHLSQLTEQLKLLINQIAASKLNELAATLTARMRTKFDKMAKARASFSC